MSGLQLCPQSANGTFTAAVSGSASQLSLKSLGSKSLGSSQYRPPSVGKIFCMNLSPGDLTPGISLLSGRPGWVRCGPTRKNLDKASTEGGPMSNKSRTLQWWWPRRSLSQESKLFCYCDARGCVPWRAHLRWFMPGGVAEGRPEGPRETGSVANRSWVTSWAPAGTRRGNALLDDEGEGQGLCPGH